METDDGMNEVVNEFLVESQENLDLLDRGFLQLEKNPSDPAVVASIFRTIHTIKGTAGFLGFGRLETLTHAGESLLSLMRDGSLVFNTPIADALLKMVDAVRRMLAQVEADRTDGTDDHEALIATLHALQTGEGHAAASAAPTAPTAEVPPPPIARPTVAALAPPAVAVTEAAQVLSAPAEPAPPPVAPAAAAVEAREDTATTSALTDSTIRVDVGLLDKLMNLVGELVLARNQVLQFTAHTEGTSLTATSQRLNLITTELQEGVMKTRMQPIGNVWSKFPRVVRDLSGACHKQVEIEMEGRDTELDKTIIEAIKDPLTHLVRNSVDHGIELPADRVKAGKPATGRLFLRAFHEGGQVNIEISDDGHGIDVEKVRNKAIQRGLITREAGERMAERELTNLIFLPGFSTAEKVSNISGRGVGMDVVRTNIEKIGGTVDLRSTLGKGTTITIKIPLTLAIIPALIVMNDGDRFAIPQVSLLELVRLEDDEARRNIELIHDAPVYRLRGNLLPLVYLSKLFQQQSGSSPSPTQSRVTNIVVLQAGDQQFGLVVAGINDTEEIVVKPLAKQLRAIPTFAGATIMGDGKVALILDVMGIAQHAGVAATTRDRNLPQHAATTRDETVARRSFLLCGVGKDARMAIPLSAVDRLEEFAATRSERAGRQTVIQYRGQILPLLWLDHMVPVEHRLPPGDADRKFPVVVFQNGEKHLGLVVDQILDIVEDNPVLEHPATRPGVLGCAVMQGKITEVLDLNMAVDVIEGPSPFRAPRSPAQEVVT